MFELQCDISRAGQTEADMQSLVANSFGHVGVACLKLLVPLMLVVQLGFPQSAGYAKRQLTFDSANHESPSLNNHGDIVWSQQIGGLANLSSEGGGHSSDRFARSAS